MRRALILALVGGVVGALLDYAHVASGTIAYTRPAIAGLAWWVPLLYACSGVAIGLSHPALDARLRRPPREVTPENVLLGVVGLAAVWGASGFLPWNDPVRALLLGPLAMLVWAACDRSRAGLLLAIGTAIVGCFVEVALTSLDAFHYVHPDAGPIASWLPWIYVTASVAVGNLGRFLSDNAPIEAAPIGPRVSDPPGRSSMPRAGGDT